MMEPNSQRCLSDPETTQDQYPYANEPIVIFIEGGIAAGKLSVLEEFSERRLLWTIVPEPVEDWTHVIVNGQTINLLENFHATPRAWAYQLQAAVMESYKRLPEIVEEAKKNKSLVIVVERSPRSAHEVFAKIQLQNGNLSQPRYDEFGELRAKIEQSLRGYRQLTFLLMADVDLAMERKEKRGRPEEKNLDPAYVQLVNELRGEAIIPIARRVFHDSKAAERTVESKCELIESHVRGYVEGFWTYYMTETTRKGTDGDPEDPEKPSESKTGYGPDNIEFD